MPADQQPLAIQPVNRPILCNPWRAPDKHTRDRVAAYVKNDHLEFSIPYEYLGAAHAYYPDFVVRLTDSTHLVLEVKGQQTPQDDAKHQAAVRWVVAINRGGQLGRWDFAVCHDPQVLANTISGRRVA